MIGAGPAGSMLGYYLAKSGFDVLIVEKAFLPRYKPCGGGIPAKTIQNLPFDTLPGLEFMSTGGIITYQGEQKLKVKVDREFAWLAMRDKFDKHLVEQAVDAGASILEGKRVTAVSLEKDGVSVSTHAEEIRGQFVAGADGVNSIVAKSSGLIPRREVGTAIEAELKVSQDALDEQGAFATFDFGALPHGYGWIFPKKDHLSVGVFQARSGKAINLKDFLGRFIECQPVLMDHKVLKIQGHKIPLGGKQETLHKGRCLLVGDAANLADPFLGEGIYHAIQSAAFAAEAIRDNLQNGNVDLSGYSRRVNTEIVSDFRYARLFANLVYRLPRFATTLFSRSPVMQNAVFGVIRGDLSFKQLNNQIILKFPVILTQAVINRGE
ncbi:MAG: geranylgeranyl reductase family protein [Anaerolineaceae bacterium]|nr:geranylgeranyl reductase family protein [Anaerolineaceae bacterium]